MVVLQFKIDVPDSVNTADFSGVNIDLPNLRFDELHMPKNAPQRIHNVARQKIACGNFVQHRGEENEILAADQRDLHVCATR